MAIEKNDSEAAFNKADNQAPDTGEGHSSGLEKAKSEPKQGTDEADAKKKRVDWTPPAGNPGSDQDALRDRDIGSAKNDDH